MPWWATRRPSTPWLDEAFATYAEQLVDSTQPAPGDLRLPGPVDRPTADYGADDKDYYRLTYGKGAAALPAARDRGRAGRRSTPRSAAMSTPMPGASPSRLTSRRPAGLAGGA